MGLKGTGGSATGVAHQNGGLYLHKALAVQELANFTDNGGALLKGVAYIRVHNQVQIALSVPGVGILQAVELLRQGQQALGEQLQLLGVNRDLTGAGLKHKAGHLEKVANVPLLKGTEHILAHIVHPHIDLHTPGAVAEIHEVGLAHIPARHHSPAQRHIRILQRVKIGAHIGGVVGLLCLGDLERILPGLLQRLQLVQADLAQFILAEYHLCHGHLSGVGIIADLFDHGQGGSLVRSRTGQAKLPGLQKQGKAGAVLRRFHQILGIGFFFVTGKGVLHLHAAILLYSLYATAASVLFLKHRALRHRGAVN